MKKRGGGNIPNRTNDEDSKNIKMIQNQSGEVKFLLKTARTFSGGIILILFSLVWSSVLSIIVMEFIANWSATWKNIALSGFIFAFMLVGLGFFYLGFFCCFGNVYIIIKHGIIRYYAGVFGVGRTVSCSLSDIQEISIQKRERKTKFRVEVYYDLSLSLLNGRVKKIPFTNDLTSAKFFEQYITENL